MPDTAEVVAQPAAFPQLDPAPASGGPPLDFLKDVPITVVARLGHKVLPIADILKLGPGAVLELDELVTQPIELTVRGVPFAAGEVVVVGDHFAVRITKLLPPRAAATED